MKFPISGSAIYCALLFIASLLVSAESHAQTVTVVGKNVPLKKVFARIEKQTGYTFFYNCAVVKDTRSVTLKVKDATLEEVLKVLLAGQGLDYYVRSKTIFITKASKPDRSPGGDSANLAETIDLKGRVVDTMGQPMTGANIAIQDRRMRTITDEKGQFHFKNAPIGGIMEISWLGNQIREVITGKTPVTIKLVIAKSRLDEVVVIGYGTTSNRMLTGNIVTIKGEEISEQPVGNPLLALEGRVPGLFVTQSNGIPGGAVSVSLQGQNSILNGNDPLYVVDGVPYASETLPTMIAYGSPLGTTGVQSGPNAVGYGNPLSYLNPGDIESITTLKDADATSIYGSRGANGVILITTKRGQTGRTRVDLGYQDGWGGVTRKLKLLNTPQYLEMREEGIANDGLPVQPTDYDINGTWDTTRYTDWQKMLIGGTARYTTVNGTLSGGNSVTQYLVGGTFHRESAVFPGNFSDQKGSFHFNFNTTSTDQRLKLQLTGNYLIDNDRLPSQDLTGLALSLPPDAPPPYNSDGTLNWQLYPGTTTNTWNNPFADLFNEYQNKTTNLIASSNISYRLLPGLDIRANLGYTDQQMNEFSGVSLRSFPPAQQASLGVTGRSATYSDNNVNSWIVEPQAAYQLVLGKSKIQALAGTTFEQRNGNGLQLFGAGFNSDALLPDIHSATNTSTLMTDDYQYKYAAGFGRISYNGNDEWLVNLTGRRDGSSRFGSAKQFHDFWALGIGFVFTREDFIKRNFPFLSYGKIRGSYGTTGNDQIGDYQFLDLYSTVNAAVPYQNTTGLGPTGLSNPFLQWETTTKIQTGLELGFWGNRVLLSANYIRNRSSNQLIDVGLPSITGFPAIAENEPASVQNVAAELSLNSININRKDFVWKTSANLTIPQNKLLSYTGQIPSNLVIGQPLGINQLFHLLGVDPATGIYSFAELHGAPTPNPTYGTDNFTLVNSQFPKLYAGLQNMLQFKQLSLEFLFQIVKRLEMNDLFSGNPPGTISSNQPAFVVDRWQKTGDIQFFERYSANLSLLSPLQSASQSDAAYSDASYIRLKNLSLSYQIAPNVLHRTKLQGCRVFVQGQNLLTLTRFKGLDPETGSGSLPPLKIITTGLQVGL